MQESERGGGDAARSRFAVLAPDDKFVNRRLFNERVAKGNSQRKRIDAR